MLQEFLSRIFFNQSAVLIIVSLILVTLAEAGYRIGIATRKRNPAAADAYSGSAQGAVLGLLGLLLGFSFAMAVGRYESRRDLALKEANSIGTTWLRADFLPPEHIQPVKDLLVRYTQSRIEASRSDNDKESISRFCKEAQEIHEALWKHTTEASQEQPSPITASFVTTLNEMIDLHSDRLAALRNHVPAAVWLLLLAVSGCGAWSNGQSSGCAGHRSVFSQVVFPLLIGVVITLISDIDRPKKGLIGVSQQPIEDLLETIKPDQP